MLYQPLKHLLSLPVNIHKIAVQFAACQQVGVKRFAVILFTFATPDKLFCLILRYQPVSSIRDLFSNFNTIHPAVLDARPFQSGGDSLLLLRLRLPSQATSGGDLPGHRNQPPRNASFQTVFFRRHSCGGGVKGHHQAQFLLELIWASQ